MNVWGYEKVISSSRARYFVNFINDYPRRILVYFLKEILRYSLSSRIEKTRLRGK